MQQLKNLGAEKTTVLAIAIMLSCSEKALREMILYLANNKPTLVEVSDKAEMLLRNIPKEELRGAYLGES